MTKNIILIGNPIAGGGSQRTLKAVEAGLRKRGFSVEVMLTGKRGDAELFARNVSNRPDSIVIAAGGDGTYNEVANGLVHSEVPMAILPLGTTSVLAREIGIPLNAEKALDVILRGRIETIHIGKMTCRPLGSQSASTDSDSITRHFLLMAGIGIDADAVYGVNVKLKKVSGRVAYVLSGLTALANYRPEEMNIEARIEDSGYMESGRFRIHPDYVSISGNRLETTGYVAVVSKASCYGGDFCVTPDADLREPYLYTIVLHKKGKIALMHLLFAIITGRPLRHKHISYFRTEDISINGLTRMQIDGDYAGRAPVKIEVVRNALKLVVPA
jgi:diacylglycerol kinase (ATP)